MAFDGITMTAVKNELEESCIDAKIDKIYQINKHDLLLNLRKNREKIKLYLSAHPVYARICMTEYAFSNPKSPPLFCMVLRKHLEGGKIVSITQPAYERILMITVAARTELGELTNKILVIEIMGKHSNIILLQSDGKTIIDSIKRVPLSTSSYRQILPGSQYISPPVQNKLLVHETSFEMFINKLMDNELTISTEKALLNTFLGFGPNLCSQITKEVNLHNTALEFFGEYELNSLWRIITRLSNMIKNNTFTPVISKNENNNYQDFSPFNFSLGEKTINFPSINKAIDEFYTWLIKHHNYISTKANLEKQINKELNRCQKKLALQLSTVNKSSNNEKYRIYGELLTANMHLLKRGMDKIEVINYYDQNKPTIIELKPELTPSENAQKYFQKYNKLKNAAVKTLEQVKQTQEEIKYLDSLKFWLSEIDNFSDFYEIEKELIESGYLKPEDNKKRETKQKPIPRTIKTQDGFTVYVGKNNKQNDWLTFKVAKEDDLWFHAKDIPGSHVILKLNGKRPTNSIIEKAALLAAYYSKGKYSANLPVDYTEVNNVKKIKGAKPGLVTYVKYKTIYVTPDKNNLSKI